MLQQQYGFSLIELTLAMMIIAITLAIAMPRFLSLDVGAHEKSVQATAAQLQASIKMIAAKHIFFSSPGSISVDGTSYSFNNSGVTNDWPVGNTALATTNTPTVAGCIFLFNNGLKQGPNATSDTSGDYQATVSSSTCRFTYLRDDPNAAAATPKLIIYDITDGSVSTQGL